MNNINKVCFDVECPVCKFPVACSNEKADYFCNRCATAFTWCGLGKKQSGYKKILQLAKANKLSCEEVLHIISELCDEECTCTPGQQTGKDVGECLRCTAATEYNDIAYNIRNAARNIIRQKLTVKPKTATKLGSANTVVEKEQNV